MKFNFTIVQTYLKSTKIKEDIIKTSYFNGVLKRLFICEVSHNNALKYFLNIQKIFFITFKSYLKKIMHAKSLHDLH